MEAREQRSANPCVAATPDVSTLPPLYLKLLETLPPAFGRTAIEALMPGGISRGYLQNLDSDEKGPEKIYVGRKVLYIRESFVLWLWKRSTSSEK